MMIYRSLMIVSFVVAVAGCKIGQSQSADALNQQAASASQALGMLLDASMQTVLSEPSVSSAAQRFDRALPTFSALASSTQTIDLANVTVNGRLLFPSGTVSGTIEVVTAGAPITSWPTGSTTLYTGSVQVLVHDLAIVNGNGDRLIIPSGGFSHTLAAQANRLDAENWTVTVDATATVTPAIAATLTRRGVSHTLSLSGTRRVTQVITRVKNSTTDTRSDARVIDGPVAGSTLTSNPALAADNYTSWTVRIDGIPVTWNRHAQLTVRLDYNQTGAAARTIEIEHDASFISTSVGGLMTVIGPLTTGQGSLLLQAQLDPLWL